MLPKLVKYLACPQCHQGLDLQPGQLRCPACRRRFPIVNGIPRFVSSDQYVNNFSFEWHKHRTTQLDSFNKNHISRDTFFEKTGFTKKDLNGKLVLDVGCGMGRFMEIAANHGATVIGVDLSTAVEAAKQNLYRRRNCHFIQADIFQLPFKPTTFDTIFSIGVLHHTPNTKKAFMTLPPLLKRGGRLAIWVYGQNQFRPLTHFGDLWRQFTVRVPKKLLYYLCYFSLPAYYLYKIPHLGSLINIVIPFSTDPNWRWRLLDTFDWYSPKYQWLHTYPEVISWFEEAKLKVIKILKHEASVLGQKP